MSDDGEAAREGGRDGGRREEGAEGDATDRGADGGGGNTGGEDRGAAERRLEPISADLLVALEAAAGEAAGHVAELMARLQEGVGEMAAVSRVYMDAHDRAVIEAEDAVDGLIATMQRLMAATASLNTQMRPIPAIAAQIHDIKALLSTLESAAGKLKAQ